MMHSSINRLKCSSRTGESSLAKRLAVAGETETGSAAYLGLYFLGEPLIWCELIIAA